MSRAGGRVASPFRVTITPVSSPKLASKNSHDKPRTPLSYRRGQFNARLRSESPCTLQVPQLSRVRNSSLSRGRTGKGDNQDNDDSHTRSRSYSPFGHSKQALPCGSPVFERVLSDMRSNSDLSVNNGSRNVKTK
ncbi:uncharacterized protein LOC128215111 [Mya arenaria]|uniref:uncharacterized protein LOC128215111 n=1 Tax=Mya arenaria TaxID=6604 RepID=UPI0022E84617|nr:uncharacterized protein LOC128215111 [Mya arenaria]